jgi:DNA-binding MurR/RpiR family transcriptional regulator
MKATKTVGRSEAGKSTISAVPRRDSVLASVEEQLVQFRPAEVKVANVLLANPDDFFQWTVTEVADRAGVSEASVIRFAKLLGFTGFQTLKITLAQERATAEHGVLEVEAGDDWASALVKLNDHYAAMLTQTLLVAQHAQFRIVLDLIRKSPQTLVLGAGTSGLAAHVLQYKLSRIGMHSIYHTDAHFQALAAASCHDGDVAIAFSVSGSTRDAADALSLAKEAGATTVAITHFVRSPIARIADHVLLSQGFDSPVVSGSVLAHVSQLILVDALYLGLTLENYEEAIAQMEQSAEHIARYKKY